jgi:hypothetical protein
MVPSVLCLRPSSFNALYVSGPTCPSIHGCQNRTSLHGTGAKCARKKETDWRFGKSDDSKTRATQPGSLSLSEANVVRDRVTQDSLCRRNLGR